MTNPITAEPRAKIAGTIGRDAARPGHEAVLGRPVAKSPIGPRKKKVKRATKTNAAGRRLMTALRDAKAAIDEGDPFRGMSVREVEVPDPAEYAPADVRALRARLNVSTRVFASMVGVTPAQVEHWEQGRRAPNPMARRLFDRLAADATGALAALVRRRTLPPAEAR